METGEPGPRQIDVPPWLWLWIGFFLISLPQWVGVARGQLEYLAQWQAATAALGVVNPDYGRLDWLLIPSFLLDVLPRAALLLGVVAAALPSWRRLYVERRYRLAAPPPLPVVGEIEAWVAARRPQITVRANLLRPAPLAFVYPRGYGRSSLALFGGLVVLWRTDRPAAEAVLRHELAHHDRGDVAILGVGSLFETVLRFTGLYYVLLFLLPMLIISVGQALQLYRGVQGLGVSAGEVWWYKLLQFVTLEVPGQIAIAMTYLLSTMAALVVPLAGIWMAEFAADRRVVECAGGEEAVRRALAATGQRRVPWWRWLLMRLSHPPLALRRVALRAQRWPAAVAILLAFPAAFALRLVALHGAATLSYVQTGLSGADIAAHTLQNTRAFLSAQAPAFLAMGALLAVWPVAAGRWEGLWAGAVADPPRLSLAPYVLCALLLVAVALPGLV